VTLEALNPDALGPAKGYANGVLAPAGARTGVEAVEALLLLLAPFAPYVAEELWESIGHATSIFRHPWPVHDPAALVRSEVEIAIQVNGKVRHKAMVPADADDGVIRDLVLAMPKIAEAMAGKPAKMVKVVKNRLVNIVV